jgi:L-ascorbate metabolism protein UlaG (beta-lactamase superfamily)
VKKLLYVLLVVVVILIVGYNVVDYLISAPAYTGPKTDHFDGRQFQNLTAAKPKGLLDVLRWRLTKEEGPWPESVNAEPGPRPPERVKPGELRITFVNHSTFLIQMDGLNILTDPVWSERTSPVSWAGPKRVRPPGIQYKDLPPIDIVLVSHNHYDHLDIPTLQRLSWDHIPSIFTGLGNNLLLEKKKIKGVSEMDWWDAMDLKNGVRLMCVPAQHWSGRGFRDRMKTLWCGYVIKGRKKTIYFAGCTGFGPHFEQIASKSGPIHISLLPIGAFRPRWFMESAHLSPADAINAHEKLKSKESIVMHYGTFKLGDDGYTEPLDVLKQELTESDSRLRSSIHILEFGQGKNF